MLNTFAALASATTLFFRACRSIDCTPKAICGCWSMKRSWLFSGVRTSRYLDMVTLSFRDAANTKLGAGDAAGLPSARQTDGSVRHCRLDHRMGELAANQGVGVEVVPACSLAQRVQVHG